MTEPTRPCGTCGMPCNPGEYHPYAACLMFKACHNSETVRANLAAVRGSPVVVGEPVARWEFRWLNPADNKHIEPSELEWQLVCAKGFRSVESVLHDLQQSRYHDKPVYEVRALYAATAQPVSAGKAEAYCIPCQKAGMSNCSDFTHCGQPKCITCHRYLDAPQPTQAQAGADAVVEEVANGLRRYGLTLVKTASGYDVLSLREVDAHGIKGGQHG